MPVNSEHAEYIARSKQWQRCRDVIGGTDAIKDKNTEYLPKLDDKQSQPRYDAYLTRALFYGATGRTVQGLLGAVFRKDYVIEDYPFEEHLKDITPDGLEMDEFARNLTKQVLSVSRVGGLVDIQDTNEKRAYVATYKAEAIVNWKTIKIEGVQKLSLVVLRETYTEPVSSEDEFEVKALTQYRVLKLTEGSGDDAKRIYSQEVWRKQSAGNKEAWVAIPELGNIPKRGGQALDFIPFIFINSNDLTPKVEKPSLLDMADVNLSHYRTSADLEHGAHFTALPTPWMAGFETTGDWAIGSGVAWVTSNPEAKVGMLEYTGQGLQALEVRLKEKENAMAVLGARMLEEQKNAVEAEGTQRLRRSGETGALAAIVTTCSSGIAQLLKWMAWWSSATDAQVEKIVFTLNMDFYDIEMQPELLTALVAALQGGTISVDTFLYNMKVGEILPPGTTIDDEKDKIEAEGGFGNEGDDNDNDNGNVTSLKRSMNVNRNDDGKVTSIEEA